MVVANDALKPLKVTVTPSTEGTLQGGGKTVKELAVEPG